MINEDIHNEVMLAIRTLHDILPQDVRQERPWLEQLDEDILFILGLRHVMKTGRIHNERRDVLLELAHRRLQLSPKQAALEKSIHLVDSYRFRQQKATVGLQFHFPILYQWLQETPQVNVILWHVNDPVFRRVRP